MFSLRKAGRVRNYDCVFCVKFCLWETIHLTQWELRALSHDHSDPGFKV